MILYCVGDFLVLFGILAETWQFWRQDRAWEGDGHALFMALCGGDVAVELSSCVVCVTGQDQDFLFPLLPSVPSCTCLFSALSLLLCAFLPSHAATTSFWPCAFGTGKRQDKTTGRTGHCLCCPLSPLPPPIYISLMAASWSLSSYYIYLYSSLAGLCGVPVAPFLPPAPTTSPCLSSIFCLKTKHLNGIGDCSPCLVLSACHHTPACILFSVLMGQTCSC